MAGRPKKPVELKKLEGTYRQDRDSETEKQEKALNAVLPVGKLKITKEVTDPEIKRAYKDHVEMLRALGGMAEQKADSPMLAEAYWALQEAVKIRKVMECLSPLDEEYDGLLDKQLKLFGKYEKVVKEFFVTPNSRVKLKLDSLTATEKTLNITEKKSAVATLLERKES